MSFCFLLTATCASVSVLSSELYLCVLWLLGSPVVWVTWCYDPSQLPQMVRAQQLSTSGERGGSVVITSWLRGSVGAGSKSSARTGTSGWVCRLYVGLCCLKEQVKGVCPGVYSWAVSRYTVCTPMCRRECVWPLMLLNAAAHTWRTFCPEHFLWPSSCLFVQPSERTLRSFCLLLCCFSPDYPAISV